MAVLAFALGACLPKAFEADARARNAANTAAYTAELDACYNTSKSFANYKACADDVDFRYKVADAQTGK